MISTDYDKEKFFETQKWLESIRSLYGEKQFRVEELLSDKRKFLEYIPEAIKLRVQKSYLPERSIIASALAAAQFLSRKNFHGLEEIYKIEKTKNKLYRVIKAKAILDEKFNRRKYIHRLSISIEGNDETKFYSYSGCLLAKGYLRVVIGERGPYVEFSKANLVKGIFEVPEVEKWRLNNTLCYYVELRTPSAPEIKLYFQKKEVDYADYKIGKFYISPFDLYNEQGNVLIEKLRNDPKD